MSNNNADNYIVESSRCLHCAKPTCRQACPLGNDIPRFLQLVSDGKLSEAVQVVGHPFGEICGFVCPHDMQCHSGCVLSKRGQAVKMGDVEKSVFSVEPYKVERKGSIASKLKVAVVGGGVAGITFAVAMYEQGANVTLYERDELLSTLKLIPCFRLPREAIDRVLSVIDGKFKIVKKSVGCHDLVDLQQKFEIVYVATGASKLLGLGIVGEELATPYDEFLKSGNKCGNTVVIGGGNTAMDCARLAKRSGGIVTVAYRRTRDDMPAFNREIEEAVSDGVDFVYNVAPVKLEQQNGKLLLTLAKTVNEGRGKLTVTDETSVIECDTVVSALGSRFDSSIYGTLQVDDEKHPLPNVYAGGDAVGGKIVVNAVAHAIKTAQEIFEQYKTER